MTRISARLLAHLPFLIGPLAYLAPKGLTVLLAVLAVIAIAGAWPPTRADAADLLRAGRPVLGLLAVCLASIAWSVAPALSAQRAGQIWALAVLGAVLALAFAGPRRIVDRDRLLVSVATGFAVAAVFVLADLSLAGSLSHWARPVPPGWLAVAYSRGSAVHAILALPMVIALWAIGQRRLAGLMLLLAATPFALEQVAAKLALIAAAIAAIAVYLLPTLRWALVALQLVAVLLPLTLLPQPYTDRLCSMIDTKASIIHRITIWNFAYQRWSERPLLGWGLSSSRAVPGGNAPADFLTPCGRPVRVLPDGRPDLPSVLPLHPHNSIVQIWLELGALGALALSWLIFAVNRGVFVRQRTRAGRAAAAAASAGLFTVAVISFGAWQSWWWAAAILVLALTTAAGQSNAGRPPSGAR